MKKSALCFAISSALLSTAFATQAANVTVLDKTHSPAANFLAYTEFELSGEPLAESLGLDLDVLDPNQVDQPTAFDYAAGIESYEYSEEAMYALNYQSSMGPHLVNGPVNQARGGSLSDLGKRFIELAASVGFPSEEIPLNMYPISLPYVSGNPEFVGKVDTTKVNGEALEVLSATGKAAVHNTVIPAYFRDYKTLVWDNASFDKALNPGAIGSIFLKEVMWSQDFLGGMHVTATDEEVEATSSTMDQDGKHSLGVSAADGFNGVILTEMSLDKLLVLQQQLGYDGKKLGVKFGPDYDATKKPIWFAHKVAVTETQKNDVNNLGKLVVADGSSSLRDTWMLLWPVSEFYAFTDQRTANTAQNPAFTAVFDGKPFAAAPKQNVDGNSGNNVIADDAFSVASNIANLSFQNLANLHFNKKAGTFVTKYDGKQNAQVTTFDAAYSLVALSIYQRSQDALPVGYASAAGGDVDIATPQGKQALSLIKAQADYIVNELVAKNGLVYDGATLGKSVTKTQSLDAQFAAIRGLVAAFLATEDASYKQAARAIFLAVEKNMYDPALGTWAQIPGKATIHTPYTAAAISGGLRETMLHLANEEGEHIPALELQHLTERYTAWFKRVVNGGQQLSEWVGDSGENLLMNDPNTDSDNDGVRQVTAAGGKFGTAQTMAAKVSVSAK
ncbi:MAG: hypothetical protein ACI86X_001712 [Moritella sp.]